jgi:haloacid dehalogenase superfamily, subfamily IA, variant 1 with third motif having Dx(3-4)D or Dx(3-4)E
MGSRIDKILSHLGCMQYIDNIIGYENVSTHKPNPEGLINSVNHFKYNKEDVLYVGDSYIDAEAAQNAEIDFVGVTTGTTMKKDFEKYNNIKIVDSLSQIIEVI